MKRILLTLTGLFLAIPASVFAIGQMTEPIVVNNAAKGQKIIEELILFNSDDVDQKYGLTADGDIEGWEKFYTVDDLENPITSIVVPAESNISAMVEIQVPSDAANKVYNGILYVTTDAGEAKEAEGPQITTAQRIGRDVSIIVTGEEQIGADVSVIPVSYEIGTGEPLEVRFQFYNTGNVEIRPDIQAKIKDIDQTEVLSTTIYPYPENADPVKALERTEIEPLKISTTELSDGQYWIEFTVTADDVELTQEKFRFTVGRGGSVLGTTTFSGFKTSFLAVGFGLVILIVVVLGVAVAAKKKRK